MAQTDTDARAALQSLILAQAAVNDPFLGEGGAQAFCDGSMLWPGERWSAITHVATTETPDRSFHEYRYTPADGGRILPVAFMVERQGGASVMRIYSNHHLVPSRDRILEVTDGLHPWKDESDVLYTYFQKLNGGLLEELLDLFEADGYFRHSNDDTFTGREELRGDFVKMMAGGGIRIDYCRLTDDGRTCAVECYMPSGRPAVATYERGAPGYLKAVRIYL